MGGHTKALLEATSEEVIVYAFDWNRESMEMAKKRLEKFRNRIRFIPYNFVKIPEVLQREGLFADGVLLDLGLSSFLIEGSGKGFTFQKDEPLDMRMSPELTISAKDILNKAKIEELTKILKEGEVPKADSFAQFLHKRRKERPFETTFDFCLAIKEFYKPPFKKERDFFALIFQAIRIYVNKELENLKKALAEIPDILKIGGRFIVISYHSLEDRIVKRAFLKDERLEVLTKKPITPKPEEIKKNLRARSAKMRVAQRRF